MWYFLNFAQISFFMSPIGITGSNGRLWKEHRTFTIAGLRSFDFGKRSFESQVAEEVMHFLKEVEDKGGNMFRMADIIPVATSNIICSISFGKRFEYSDKRLSDLIDIMNNIFVMGTQTTVLFGYFPWMRVLPWNRYDRVSRVRREIRGGEGEVRAEGGKRGARGGRVVNIGYKRREGREKGESAHVKRAPFREGKRETRGGGGR